MSDITFPASRLVDLSVAVAALFPLQPPPTPKGRYRLAKIAQAISNEIPEFQRARLEVMKKHAPKGESGEPILIHTQTPQGTAVNCDPVDAAAFRADDADLGSTVITLAGLAPLTHAELGDCPVPQGAFTAMLGVLILDEEPE